MFHTMDATWTKPGHSKLTGVEQDMGTDIAIGAARGRGSAEALYLLAL